MVRTDKDGHRWPLTGFFCIVCRWPLHPVIVQEGHSTHPGCEAAS